MAKKKQNTQAWFKKQISTKQFFTTIVFVLVLVLVIIFFYTSPQFNKNGMTSNYLFQAVYSNLLAAYDNLLPTPTLAPSTKHPSPLTPISSTVETSQYTSTNLGISFYYASFIRDMGQYGLHFYVREIRNIIYLYDDFDADHNKNDEDFLNTVGPHGKTVNVFYKDPQQSLIDAIKQKIFNGNIPSQCYITTNTHYGAPREDESYERAVISEYTTTQTRAYSYQQMRNYILSCTTYASNYGGVSYFMMDPKHSDRFLFIALGQDNIPSGHKGYLWDATIKVF